MSGGGYLLHNLGAPKFLDQKLFWTLNILSNQNYFGPKNIWDIKIFGPKKFQTKHFLHLKSLIITIFYVKHINKKKI